jgi:protein-tyrosine phosphatase
MVSSYYSRVITFESVLNFRDLGGYQAGEGRVVSWRRLFRSGNLAEMTNNDFTKFHGELGVGVVIDLRSGFEIDRQGLGKVSHPDIIQRNGSFVREGGKKETNDRQLAGIVHMGELYLNMVREPGFGEKIVEAMEIIGGINGSPVVFHCFAGKDRTGILAAAVLGSLNVADQDIAADYAMSTSSMKALREKVNADKTDPNANKLPDFFWETGPEIMSFFLASIKREYGSMRGYLHTHGADDSLFGRLEEQLLV